MGERLGGDDIVGPGLLSFIEALRRRVVAPREVGRLDKGPSQILVAVLGIALPLLPAVAGVPALDAACIGGVVADIGKAPDRAGFEQNHGGKGPADPRYALQQSVLGTVNQLLLDAPFNYLNLYAEGCDHSNVGLKRKLHIVRQRHHLDVGQTKPLDLVTTDAGTKLARGDVFHRQNVHGPVAHQLHSLAGKIPRCAQFLREDRARRQDTQAQQLGQVAGMKLMDVERECLRQTLMLNGGNREKTAKMLGIGERTLYRKIKEYNIE